MKQSADYVIVGAGSAGCALARRLGEAGCDVLVLEYGCRDGGVFIDMPAALSYPMNMSKYDWGYAAEAEETLNGRRLACPRGKVWGGSSAINGMVYVRGHREDFNHWHESGARGWAYRDVLPYFKRMENTTAGDADWRGKNGPLHITRAAATHPLHQAFLAAGKEAGCGFTADYNGEHPEGVCHFEQTIHGGVRQSAARAYLRPALRLPNVSLRRGVARRIVFDGARAIAVEAEIDGVPVNLRANREIILCASAINSPKLLLLSGIGNEVALNKLGIRVVAPRRGVGQNLQDHMEVYVQQQCKKPITLNRKLGVLSKAAIGAQWLFLRSGDGATNHFESGAFLRSPAAAYADVQIHFLPAAIRYDGKAAAAGDGFQAHVGPMRSNARGYVELRDANPQTPPRIKFNYLSGDGDWAVFQHGINMAREIFSQPAMAAFCGAPIAPADNKNETLNAYVRQHAESAYHPCGTCRMGAADDDDAVVDSDCRVIGATHLRVVDSSIFPRIPYGNINAPSMMVGEKAADHILGKI